MERTYTLQDLLTALWRRRLLAFLAMAVVLAGATAFILSLPTEYQATSMIQVEPHHLTPDFWPAQSMGSFEDRMRALKHGILARPVLERVIREASLYPEHGDDMDEKVNELRRHVEVRLEGEVAGGPPALLFVVEVRGRDRQAIAKAADLLPKAYADTARQVLSEQARNLRQTLDRQAAEMSSRLAADERRLLEFKAQHAVELPEAVDANLRAVARLESQIEVRLGSIVDARRRRTQLLSSLPEAESDAGRAQAAAEDALRRLRGARAAYGSDYPDVKRVQREWEEARQRAEAERRRFRAERMGPHLQLIDAELREDHTAIQGLEKTIAELQARIDAAPRWGEQARDLSRDYEALRAKYNATVARAADAQAAETLLTADSKGLFRFLQPAVTTQRPVGPSRWSLLGIALAVAAGVGLAAAAAAEYLDSSLRGPEDAAGLGVPVLAAIPRIGPRRAARRSS
jgi:succinoglycan biosynthesis transport protein ExoP